jgi:hypothetical protein
MRKLIISGIVALINFAIDLPTLLLITAWIKYVPLATIVGIAVVVPVLTASVWITERIVEP